MSKPEERDRGRLVFRNSRSDEMLVVLEPTGMEWTLRPGDKMVYEFVRGSAREVYVELQERGITIYDESVWFLNSWVEPAR